MNVISRKRLEDFWQGHSDSKAPLKSWYNICRKARWENLDDVQEIYSHADLVGDCTVFNIGGIDILPPPNADALWRGIPTLSAVAHFS